MQIGTLNLREHLTLAPEFSASSFGYRLGKSAQVAVQQVKGYIKQGLHQAVGVDLGKFFDTVSHDVLMSRVSRRINDKRLVKLIGRYQCLYPSAKAKIASLRSADSSFQPLSRLYSMVLSCYRGRLSDPEWLIAQC